MTDTPETDALARLEARWREHARRQRVLIARGQCLNPAALGGMADANEARADDLAAIRRAQPPAGASAILIALTEAADELDGIIHFYRPEGWDAGDLSSARELLPRLRTVLAQGWTEPDPSADAQRIGEIEALLSDLRELEDDTERVTCELDETWTAWAADVARRAIVALQRVEQAETQRAEQAAELEAWQAWAHVMLDADAPYTDAELRDAVALDLNAEHDRAERAESALAAARQEVDTLARLSKEATNGWACYARTKLEHSDIARLHKELDDLAAARLRLKEEKSREVPQVQAEGGDRHRTIRGDGVSVPEVQARSEAYSSEVAAARLRDREERRPDLLLVDALARRIKKHADYCEHNRPVCDCEDQRLFQRCAESLRALADRETPIATQYRELRAATTEADDLDHAAVVLIAQANAEDSRLADSLIAARDEALQDRAVAFKVAHLQADERCALEAEIARLSSQLAGVREALERFGTHSVDCHVDGNSEIEVPCDCGFYAALHAADNRFGDTLKYTAVEDRPCAVCRGTIAQGSLCYRYGNWNGDEPHTFQHLAHVDGAALHAAQGSQSDGA